MSSDAAQPRITWKRLRNSLVAAFMFGLFWLAFAYLDHLAHIFGLFPYTDKGSHLPWNLAEAVALSFASGLAAIPRTLRVPPPLRAFIGAVAGASFGFLAYGFLDMQAVTAVFFGAVAFAGTMFAKPREVSLREALTFAFWFKRMGQSHESNAAWRERMKGKGIWGKEIRLPRFLLGFEDLAAGKITSRGMSLALILGVIVTILIVALIVHFGQASR